MQVAGAGLPHDAPEVAHESRTARRPKNVKLRRALARERARRRWLVEHEVAVEPLFRAARAERDEEALEAPVLLRAPAHDMHDRRQEHRGDRVASPA